MPQSTAQTIRLTLTEPSAATSTSATCDHAVREVVIPTLLFLQQATEQRALADYGRAALCDKRRDPASPRAPTRRPSRPTRCLTSTSTMSRSSPLVGFIDK